MGEKRVQIILYKNNSELNKINKSLSDNINIVGTLRDESDVSRPNIVIAGINPTIYNYAYIPRFSRYYFISEITSIRDGVWLISMRVDVLMSFKTDILKTLCVVDHNTTTQISNYMNSNIWETLVKTKTDIISFPHGLLDSGEYILITAGG